MRCERVNARGARCLRWGPHVLHAYEPPRARGKKSKRERASLELFRAQLKARSGGYCECRHSDICGTRFPHPGEHAHHLQPNDRDEGRHDPDRGLWLCAAAHDFAHREPLEAKDRGLLRPPMTQWDATDFAHARPAQDQYLIDAQARLARDRWAGRP